MNNTSEKITAKRIITPDLVFDYMDTPIGELELCANDLGLVSVLFVETLHKKLELQKITPNALLQKTKEELKLYFAGNLESFEIPLQIKGTDFQKKVYSQLIKIPFGKTISYLNLARNLGDEKSIRAAASANGKNPVSIIIPCHRVIGTNGSLTGYAGDLWRKQWLLEHEAKATENYFKLF